MIDQTARREPVDPLSAATVRGFKSLSEETRVDIKPLTLLMGANSSGKSSIVQAMLLLKQTLDSSADAGPLLLDGGDVSFTSPDQVFSRTAQSGPVGSFCLGLDLQSGASLRERFARGIDGRFDIAEMTIRDAVREFTFTPATTDAEVRRMLPAEVGGAGPWAVEASRCFFAARQSFPGGSVLWDPARSFANALMAVIHVPARIRNQRVLTAAATGPDFAGGFQEYHASVIDKWQRDAAPELAGLADDTRVLGLTTAVQTRRADAAQLEVFVNRLPVSSSGRARDLVNVADAGSGMAEVLPALVALRVAESGQLVYIEEPEANLHPRAQVALSSVLAGAASRGVRVVVETHSALLLIGIQALIAESRLDPKLVKMHWFSRNKKGVTRIDSADLDAAGRYGDWPIDFADVDLAAQQRYIDASFEVLTREQRAGA